MRLLRQQGCKEIFIIADADGYLMSLSERRANGVGQEYRLVPVALPNGVFHPKCIYLSGPEGDLLAIGSGNITFGGFGRNLEVFEVLEANSAPGAFNDFADFLDLLHLRQDVIIPETEWISKFAHLARERGGSPSVGQESNVSLVHSVVSPVVDQIAAVTRQHGYADCITILSPFHDPAGDAVQELVLKTKAKNIRIGLPPKASQKSTFPFPLVAGWSGWNIPLTAVKPRADHLQRTLHAKWLDLDLGEGKRLTVTGSVNATRKALCSTDNIEVGVLRLEHKDTQWVNWEACSTPKDFDKASFRASGLGSKCLVQSTIRQDGILAGNIISSSSKIAGEWTGYLESGAGQQLELVVNVDVAGKFTRHIGGTDNILCSPGLQLYLTNSDLRARGWVNQEYILRLSREQRSIIRLINRDETLEDEIALLDYLSLSAHRHLRAFKRPVTVEKSECSNDERKEKSVLSISLDRLAPVDGSDDLDMDFDENKSSPDKLSDVFAQLRRRLLGESLVKSTKSPGIAEGGDDDDADHLKEKLRAVKKLLAKLDNFEEFIKTCIEGAADPENKRAAYVIWLEVKLHMLQRHREREKAVSFLKEWFHRVCSGKLAGQDVDALEQHLFTAAGILGFLQLGEPNEREALTAIHGELERFSGGDIDQERASHAILDHAVGFTSFLLDEECSISDVLSKVLASTTLRKMLADVLAEYELTGKIQEIPSLLLPRSKSFFEQLVRHGSRVYRERKGTSQSCSFCHKKLTPQSLHELMYQRITECRECSKYTVELKP